MQTLQGVFERRDSNVEYPECSHLCRQTVLDRDIATVRMVTVDYMRLQLLLSLDRIDLIQRGSKPFLRCDVQK